MASLLHFFSARPAPGRPLARTRTPTWTAAAAEVECERTRRADVLEPWYDAHRLRYRNQDPRVACGRRHGNVHEAAACAQRAMITGALADLNTGGHDPAWGVVRITPSGDEMHAIADLWFLNEYVTYRSYDGPEEGGWHYTSGTFVASHGEFATREEAQRMLHSEWQRSTSPPSARGSIHSAACRPRAGRNCGSSGRLSTTLPRSAPGTAEVSQG